MSKDQAIAGSSTLLKRSDLDLGVNQRGQGCGDSEGGQAGTAEKSYYRLHRECAREVTARRSGEPLSVIECPSSWAPSCSYISATISDIRRGCDFHLLRIATMSMDSKLGK